MNLFFPRFSSSPLIGAALATFLMGCSSPTLATFLTTTPNSQVEVAVNSEQSLPISAQANISGRKISLEVARTPKEQATGLMYRKTIPNDRGMLFLFEPPQAVSFWMKNVLVPLDMIFLNNGQVKAIAQAAPPCNTDPCPTYGPNTPVNQVIELRGGRAAELGLKVGDRVEIEFRK